jgi:hypothetical protein
VDSSLQIRLLEPMDLLIGQIDLSSFAVVQIMVGPDFSY